MVRDGASPRDCTYQVDGQHIKLTEGIAEFPAAPGSTTKNRTEVFGEPVYGDLNGDGEDDAALFLVSRPGGSGTFYYVAAALRAGRTYCGTNAVLLGDRVTPRSIEVNKGALVVTYADRRAEDPMVDAPTVRTTQCLVVRGGELAAVTNGVPCRGEGR